MTISTTMTTARNIPPITPALITGSTAPTTLPAPGFSIVLPGTVESVEMVEIVGSGVEVVDSGQSGSQRVSSGVSQS